MVSVLWVTGNFLPFEEFLNYVAALGTLLPWLSSYLIISLTASPSRESQNIVMLIVSIFAAVSLIVNVVFRG